MRRKWSNLFSETSFPEPCRRGMSSSGIDNSRGTKGPTIIAAHCAAFFWPASLYADAAGFSIPLTVIQADPQHAGTVLAGTATAQLFRSRDGGDTWTPLPFPVALRANLHALLID